MKRAPMTAAKAALLRVLWRDGSKAEIAAAFPAVSWSTLCGRAQALGVTRPIKGSWSCDQEELLRSLWPEAPMSEIRATFPRRTMASIHHRASRLGVARGARHGDGLRHRWSKADDDALTALFPGNPRGTIKARFPACSWAAIVHQAQRLHLVRARTAVSSVARPVPDQRTAGEVMAAIRAAISPSLPWDVRDDVMGEMLAGYYAGGLGDDLKFEAARFLRALDRESGRWRDASLDAGIAGTDGLRPIDLLEDENWSEPFDALDDQTLHPAEAVR